MKVFTRFYGNPSTSGNTFEVEGLQSTARTDNLFEIVSQLFAIVFLHTVLISHCELCLDREGGERQADTHRLQAGEKLLLADHHPRR